MTTGTAPSAPMTCVFVGAGNLATRLSCALQRRGYVVAGVCSRTLSSAQRLAGLLGCRAVERPEELPPAQVCFFSVKDDALPGLARRMKDWQPDAVFVHTAGSVPLDVFAESGHACGVLYPMQTFSREREVDFRRIPCFVEASDEVTLGRISAWAADLSDSVIPLDSRRRRYLHVAAVFANNFTNHCCDLAGELMLQAGLRPEWLLPLIDETAAKLHAMPARQAQTGPAVRYDREVMGRQRELVAQVSPRMAEIYDLMSESIHRQTEKNDKLRSDQNTRAGL